MERHHGENGQKNLELNAELDIFIKGSVDFPIRENATLGDRTAL